MHGCWTGAVLPVGRIPGAEDGAIRFTRSGTGVTQLLTRGILRSSGFGRKVRVVSGLIESYDAAVDAKTGTLLVVVAKSDGVYVVARKADGNWNAPTQLDPILNRNFDVSVVSGTAATFVIRTSQPGNREWVLTP
jgi:hypothetical protein